MRLQARAAIAAVALLAWLAPAPASAQDASATRAGVVEALAGTVEVLRVGAAALQRLSEGAAIFEGDRIETGGEGRVRLRFVDGTSMTLAGGTLVVEGFPPEPAADQGVLLAMAEGVVRFLVDTLVPRSSFEVHTSTAVAAVRGTEWMAEVTPESTGIVALSGEVAVAAEGVEVVLRRGEGTDVALGEPPSEPRPWGAGRISRLLGETVLP
jgi:hypothetical protein